jgi:moderate conductance mechanosensitive channel
MDFALSHETTKIAFEISLTFLVTVLLNSFLRSLIRVPKRIDSKQAQTYITIVRNTITAVLYTTGFYIVFSLLNINLTPLLTSASIIGIAIGIGARPLIEDLLTGFFLISQKTIGIGDYVKIDEAEGVVETFGMRALTIRTETGATYIIPNSQIKKVLNYSRHRANVIVQIPVKIDQHVDRVMTAVDEALKNLKKDAKLQPVIYPGSTVDGISDFKTEGLLTIQVTIITSPSKREEIARQFRYLVKTEFERKRGYFK